MTRGLCTFTYNSSWKFHQLAAGQFLSGQSEQYGKDGRYGPSITYKNQTCRVAGLLQLARRAAVLGQPSSLRPHCSDHCFSNMRVCGKMGGGRREGGGSCGLSLPPHWLHIRYIAGLFRTQAGRGGNMWERGVDRWIWGDWGETESIE